jgi:Basic region leucine zipper
MLISERDNALQLACSSNASRAYVCLDLLLLRHIMLITKCYHALYCAIRLQTKEQAEKRKERNRLLARRTRLRKKFFYQSLQQQMKGLRDHNARLKRILKERLGDEADKVCIMYSA